MLIFHQPSPTASLDTSQSSVEGLLERLEPTKRLINSLCKSTRWRLTTARVLRSQVLPEQRVVDVATSVEVGQCLQGDLGLDIGFALGTGELLNCIIIGVDVGLMMLGMMKLHDLAGDGWLKRAIVIYENIKSVTAVQWYWDGI